MLKEPLILNLETSTDVCSVCVSRGEEVLNLQTSTKAFQHSERLTLLIERCVRECGFTLKQMDAVAVGSGPGSYTSLRVGSSTAKGICYALGLPLISVDTLQALALAAMEKMPVPDGYFCPMIDARRMEVYTAIFDCENRPVSQPVAMVVEATSFDDFFAAKKTVVFTGNGAMKCKRVLDSQWAVFQPLACSANQLPKLAAANFNSGKFEEVAYYAPFYLKPPNITKPKKMSML